jgi:hypothetical protein
MNNKAPKKKAAKKKAAKKKAVAKKQGMGELLGVLKTHPHLVHALVFNPTSVNNLLKSRKARQLAAGVDTKRLLKHAANPQDGGAVAVCLRGTVRLCPKGTRCAAGTRLRPCAGGTIRSPGG